VLTLETALLLCVEMVEREDSNDDDSNDSDIPGLEGQAEDSSSSEEE
jgi:hypothetical protein